MSPPNAPRIVAAIPAVCILAALGLWRTALLAEHFLRQPRAATAALAAVALVGMQVSDARYYFEDYAHKAHFTDPNTEIADQAGRYIAELGDEYQVYFLGPPRMYLGHATLVFLADRSYVSGKDVGVDIVEPLTLDRRPEAVTADRKLLFLIVPQRMEEVSVLQHYFPTGRLIQRDGRFGKNLFAMYQVD